VSASCAVTSAVAVVTRQTAISGKFLSAQDPVHMAVSGSKAQDATWDGKKVQNDESYSKDYVADEAPAPYNSTNDTEHVFKHEQWPKVGRYTNEPKADKYGSARAWAGYVEPTGASSGDDDSEGDVTSSVGFGHAPEWYVERCEEITEKCNAQQDAVVEQYDNDLSALEAEYRRQLRILEGKEEDHADEVADVKAQKRAVAKQKMKVEDAREAVKENAHCPPELQEAKEKLYSLEAVPNKSPEDIEEECKWRKIVLEKEKCVEVLIAAQEVLRDEKDDHSEEKHELSGEKADEADAAAALPPQEKRVADAKAAWENAKRKGPKSVTEGAKGSCQADKDALLAALLADIKALEDEYLRQKAILEKREDTHADEQADVADQTEEVAQTRMKVKNAQIAVKKNAHCPPQLEEAKQHLADLEAVPNETPEDIEEECKAKKVVLEKEQCVEVLREAESVLRENKMDHHGEKGELKSEEYDEQQAADRLPPQEKRVADAKAALDAARAALEALKNCVNGGKDSGSDSSKEDASPPEARSGSVRAVASAATVVALSVLASFF